MSLYLFVSSYIVLLCVILPVLGQQCIPTRQRNTLSTSCNEICSTQVCIFYGENGPPCNATLDNFGDCNELLEQPCSVNCIRNVIQGSKWSLFIDEPNKPNPSAIFQEIESLNLPENITTFQISSRNLFKNTKDSIYPMILTNSFLYNTTLKEILLDHINLNSKPAKTLPKSLEKLHLISCNISELPKDITLMKDLKILNLSMNSLSVLNISDSDDQMQELLSLSISFNNLTYFSFNSPSVASLDLAGNQLMAIPRDIFKMKSLKSLDVSRNAMEYIALTRSEFSFLKNLSRLKLTLFRRDLCPNNTTPMDLQVSTALYNVCIEKNVSSTGEDDQTTSDASGSHQFPFVPVVVGVTAFFVFIIVSLMLLKRVKTGNSGMFFKTMNTNKDIKVCFPSPFSFTNEGMVDVFKEDHELQSLRIQYNDVVLCRILVRGGFGIVWLGKYKGNNVAVKRLLPERIKVSEAICFAEEIKLQGRLDHPKIVSFIGAAWTASTTICSITEYMAGGDLRSLLDDAAIDLTWADQKLQFSIDIIEALIYLHDLNPVVIHRDLKARNVLVSNDLKVKLSDFGLSRQRSYEETMSAGVGTARWIAPEVILGERYTEAADIYSYGVVLSEIQTRKLPFYNAHSQSGAKLQDVSIAHEVARGFLKPVFGDHCMESILLLGNSCLEFNPKDRPTAREILQVLNNKVLYEVEKRRKPNVNLFVI